MTRVWKRVTAWLRLWIKTPEQRRADRARMMEDAARISSAM